MDRGVAVVTGASSGIGAATARRLGAAGYRVVLGARRLDRLADVARSIGPAASFARLDVADPSSVAAFCDAVPECRLLVNNAGGALGAESVAEADEAKWINMYESNVLGTLRMTKALLPKLEASGDGHIVTLGSVAAFETYVGGAGYNAAKHATRALMEVLRLELLGKPVRVSEIDPGMVETEFSIVRFGGDEQKAAAVYNGMTPLSADDVAECIEFVVTRPSHVDIDQLVIRPRDQARVGLVHRQLPGTEQ
ncbi:MAG: sdh 2 [Acidimicrobiaceae bacterium]|jgi:NADP-dependent 3-hydroxy acid dehydrogenase YdfG|nr:sdh 2 [Acidimicrobiaceae bacterium]